MFATLRYKLRYNPPQRLLINALKRVGITILPYYLTLRSVQDTRSTLERSHCSLVELGPESMATIAAMPMAHASEAVYRKRLSLGQRCFGLMLDGRLVGYCWMDPARCSYGGEGFELADDEGYGFDIYTLPGERGRNLAPLLNACFSDRLEELGIRRMYGVIDRYNRPSLRFAQKIGARRIRLNLYVSLFGLFEKSWTLRRYEDEPDHPDSSART